MAWIPPRPGVRTLVAIAWLVFVWKGHAMLAKTASAPNERRPAIVAGCLSAAVKATLPHGIAMRTMPVNWRITGGDIAPGTLPKTGRYVACKLAPGEPVVAHDLREWPVLAPGEGKVTYLMTWTTPSVDDHPVNAEMKVQIFSGTGPALVSEARVLGLVCQDACSGAVIEVTRSEGLLLAREAPDRLTVIPRQ
jgi:hypothetical protein